LIRAGLPPYLQCRAALSKYAPEPTASTATPDPQRLTREVGRRPRRRSPDHPASEQVAELLERDKSLYCVSRPADRECWRLTDSDAKHWSLEEYDVPGCGSERARRSIQREGEPPTQDCDCNQHSDRIPRTGIVSPGGGKHYENTHERESARQREQIREGASKPGRQVSQ
jgi:hypothetical protein